MPDVHVIDALTGKAWSYLLAFFLYVKDEWEESFNERWRHIVSV